MCEHSPLLDASSARHHDEDDILTSMMNLERTTYACHDYLGASRSTDFNPNRGRNPFRGFRRKKDDRRITADDRAALVDWCYTIVDQCGFDRECVAAAANAVDRFLGLRGLPRQRTALRDRDEFQLLTMAALYTSIKVRETSIFGSRDLADVSRGHYSAEEIEEAERDMLHALDFRLCPPTALQVGLRIVEGMVARVQDENIAVIACSTWNFLKDELSFQTEVAVRGYYFVTQRPSTIAAAAILTALDQLNDVEYKVLTRALIFMLEKFDFESPQALLNVCEELKCLMKENEQPRDGPVPVQDESPRVTDDEQDDDSCATLHYCR